jgi:hypothetical protein
MSATLIILPDNPLIMKKKIMFLFLSICLINGGFANTLVNCRPVRGEMDTVRKIGDVVIASNDLTKGLPDLDAFDVYNNTMYIVNKNRLLQIDLNNGAITTNKTINGFLANLHMQNLYVSNLKVVNDGFWVTIFNDLYFISTTGVVKKVYHTYRFFYTFNTANDNLLVATLDSVELISKTGKSLSVLQFPLTSGNGWMHSTVGLHYNTIEEDSITAIEATGKNVISKKRYAPVADMKTIKEPFVSYVSDKYFIVIPYSARNVISLVSKNDFPKRIYKSFSIKGCTPGDKQLQMEEGVPKFRTACDGDRYFVAAIAGGHLRIFSFTP